MFDHLVCYRLLTHDLHVRAPHLLRNRRGHLFDVLKYLGTAEGLRKTIKWVLHRTILRQLRVVLADFKPHYEADSTLSVFLS